MNDFHIYLNDRSLERLSALEVHYTTKHGLPLRRSALVARAIDALYYELKLAGEMSPEFSDFLNAFQIDLERGSNVNADRVARFTDIVAKFGPPPSPKNMVDAKRVYEHLMALQAETDGQPTK